jgi:hypothetical protein
MVGPIPEAARALMSGTQEEIIMADDEEKLKALLASKLHSLRELSDGTPVSEKEVEQYHDLLTQLEQSGGRGSLSVFRVPANELRYLNTSYTPARPGHSVPERKFSKDRSCDKRILEEKITGLLAFLSQSAPDRKPKISGFGQ